jgi:hypothetical protein
MAHVALRQLCLKHLEREECRPADVTFLQGPLHNCDSLGQQKGSNSRGGAIAM